MTDWTSELNSMLGAPERPPEETNDAVLRENESELGLTFPNDFVEFARRYGTGEFCTEVYRFSVGSPFFRGWRQGCESWYKNNHYIRGTKTTPAQPRMFPEPGGLLPFGSTDDFYFCWKTAGNPEDWPVVVVWDYKPTGIQEFPMGFAEFWVKFLWREFTIVCWPSTWDPATDVSFQQHPSEKKRR